MRINRTLEEMHRSELLRKAKEAFQVMVRAEAGLYVGNVWVACPDLSERPSVFRHCVCVTCGRSYPWKGTNLLDTGHCVPGRRQCIVFDPRNVGPQCKSCNRHHGGYPDRFARVVAHVHGEDALAELRQKNRVESVTWAKPELIEMIRTFRDRTKAAADGMK